MEAMSNSLTLACEKSSQAMTRKLHLWVTSVRGRQVGMVMVCSTNRLM